MRSYVVQAGDTPGSIAGILAGCPKCSRDLVRENSHKPAVQYPNGFLTFRELSAGEELKIPQKWFSRDFEERPRAYFAALPSADGVSPSSLGDGALGVLHDYSLLDSATAKIGELSALGDAEFAAAAGVAVALMSQALQQVSGANPIAAGHAQDAQASLQWAAERVMQMAAAWQAGDNSAAAAARADVQRVLATALESTRLALKALYADAPASVPAAVKSLISIDPCASVNSALVCAAQAALGLSPDGKYGDDTALALRALIPEAPSGCKPRPAWWAPTGAKNCPGSSPVLAPPSLPPSSYPPEQQTAGLSTAGMVGLALIGAGVVGGAIYLTMNPKAVAKILPANSRPTIRYSDRPTKRY